MAPPGRPNGAGRGRTGAGPQGRGGACSRDLPGGGSPRHPPLSAAAPSAHRARDWTRCLQPSQHLCEGAGGELPLWTGQVLEGSKVALLTCFKGPCTNHYKGQQLVPGRTHECLFIYYS